MIENTKLHITLFQKLFSQSLQAIEPFTRLFDITARSTVLAATPNDMNPLSESTDIVCVIASTSASPETIPSAE